MSETMTRSETVSVWHDAVLNNLEVHHATYLTHTFARHMHETYVLGLIEAGVQSFTYRGARQVTPAGGVFLIHPGEAHTGEAVSASGYTYRTLYPDVPFLQYTLAAITERESLVPFFPQPVIEDPQVTSRLLALHQALARSHSALERETRFVQVWATLLTRYAELRPAERALGQERPAIRQVRRYIDEHYAQGVTLTELAQMVGLSPYYLLRVFVRDVGLPPHAYLESVRIRQAQRLLTQGLPLAQVAAILGFSHQSHLTRHFKQILGVTPGVYRQQYHQGPGAVEAESPEERTSSPTSQTASKNRGAKGRDLV
jgi:AraC-like DNA-binding protein